MGPSQSLIFLLLQLIFHLCTLAIATSSKDYAALVFKGCAEQNFQDSNGVYQQTLKSLMDTLISQSSSTKFYKTTAGGGAASSSAIDGLFQCRGDLSNADCNSCVGRIPSLAQKLCGQAIAARVQLAGCYVRYGVSGFRQAGGTELLYKICSSDRASGDGFEERLNSALGEIVKGVGNGNVGFYAGAYESVYVLGQCQGDLSSGDCVGCVKNAIDRADSECNTSISAQIYLQSCYISYAYYPSGVPAHQQSLSPSGTGRNTQKTVALVLGGLVGVGLVMSCLLFTKSVFNKKPNAYKFNG